MNFFNNVSKFSDEVGLFKRANIANRAIIARSLQCLQGRNFAIMDIPVLLRHNVLYKVSIKASALELAQCLIAQIFHGTVLPGYLESVVMSLVFCRLI